MVVDILSRLPLKSFFRCKCVSKSWISLSSDAVRLNKHLEPTMRGFFYNHAYGAGFVNFSSGINKVEHVEVDGTMSALSCHDQYLEILDCCNGLLLVKASNKKSRSAHDIHVYNPVTRTLFTLWSYKQLDDKLLYDVFSLAFDPQVFHQFHVIRFTGKKNPKFNFIDIFSFERGECKHHKKLTSHVRINYQSKGTFIDGRVHRLTTQDEILSVDPNNCSYQVIRPPNVENRVMVEIGQSEGVLHCLCVCSNKICFIWVLNSYTTQEWTLKRQLNFNTEYQFLSSGFNHFTAFIRLHFLFHPEKNVLFLPVGEKMFVSVDLSQREISSVGSLGHNGELYCWIYTPCYLV
ncbi:F-box protein At5g07610-like isoform X2 [Carex rostrata]